MPIGRQQKVNLTSDPIKNLYVDSISGGLNTLVSPQKIKDNECSILLNAQITEDGVVSRRDGTLAYDAEVDGTKVSGLAPFTTYASTGVATKNLLKVDSSGNLRKLNLSTKQWSTITGFTYEPGNPVEFAQGPTTLGYIYMCDGKNPLTYTDGTTITSYSAITDPTAGLALSTAGTAGTTKYTYAYTLVGAAGETKPCANVDITTGNATLTATNYNILTITRSTDANVTAYNVYGKTATAMFYLGSVKQTNSGNAVFNDTGIAAQSMFGLPTYNTTTGPVFSSIKTYHDTLIGLGDPQNPSKVYYSAGLDKFDSFSLADGGGNILVNPEDGDRLTGVEIYKDKLILFKNRSHYLLSFGAGSSLTTIQIINPSIGAAGQRSIKAVVNDVYFLSPTGAVYTAGYQQGYYGTNTSELIRTQELTIKVHPTIATINKDRILQACAVYSVPNYKYILSYSDGASTVNNKMLVFDTRYNAWVVWDNMNAGCLTSYVDSNNNEIVLYGDDSTGRVVQMFTGTSDQGQPFTFRMRSKDFNVNAFHLLKTWIWPTYHFRNILGTISTTIITDGSTNQSITTIGSTTSFTGWGFDRWGTARWGTTAGTGASATSADAPRQKVSRFTSRSIMFLIENTSATDSFTILGYSCRYILHTMRRLQGQYLIN